MQTVCKNCKKQIDTRDSVCPFCGIKKPARVPKTGCLIFVVLGALIALWLLNEERPYYVDRDKANYRVAPKGDVLGYLKRGTPVFCREIKDGWCETQTAQKRAIYLPMSVLTKNKAPQFLVQKKEQKIQTEKISPKNP